MGQVIALCRGCGFEIPADAPHCTSCDAADVPPSLAARQVAGLALPTRSVHPLPNTTPRGEPVALSPAGSPDTTRTLISVSSVFAVASVLAIVLGWAATTERLVLEVPSQTATRLYDAAIVLAWIAMGMLIAAVVALAAWGVRRARRRRRRDVVVLPR